ncbi:hypothetical protein JWG39_07030 [Desulforhopalus vacuolatus]|uniref:hypothetical protein n=1 Tax=Desulforhopalus vacuolatus TaxID=40414 RepID=UPI00196442C0|nr:hypothetical protein [Desulforhopalus vacuolatus]MBM9519572.1 hypothetical protein [Desulforhopalus vacuolatus]
MKRIDVNQSRMTLQRRHNITFSLSWQIKVSVNEYLSRRFFGRNTSVPVKNLALPVKTL